MPYQRKLIANPRAGLELDLQPWLLANDAFTELYDCYSWRGRIIKRNGSRYVGQIGRYEGPTSLGTHTTNPQTFTGTFSNSPVIPGSVFISDPYPTSGSSSIVYQDDENGNLLAIDSNTAPPVPVAIQGVTYTETGGTFTVTMQVAAHPFSSGQMIWMTQIGGISGINGVAYTVSSTTATTVVFMTTNAISGVYAGGGFITWYGGPVGYYGTNPAFSVTFYTPGNSQTVSIQSEFYVYNAITGIANQQLNQINDDNLVVFDYQKAYRFNNATGLFNDISYLTSIPTQSGAFSWNGNVNGSNIFWSWNYANALFVTNYQFGQTPDPIYYLATDGGGVESWVAFKPWIDSAHTEYVQTALMIFSYRGRLVLLSTVENDSVSSTTQYQRRARWSWLGTPYYENSPHTPPSPYSFNINAWISDLNGFGDFADAPTNDIIVSAEFINDVLVVFFENSTWVLRFTYDPQAPFVWERVNDDYGSESTFSTLYYKNQLFTVGLYGLVHSNGSVVERIDEKIPDTIFNFQNQTQETIRVYGIRNFQRELLYWAYPTDSGVTFPNQMLCYNYLDKSWSIFRDSYTCFGSWQSTEDQTWSQATIPWESANTTWGDPLNSPNAQLDPLIVGGNQQGFIMQLDAVTGSFESLTVQDVTANGEIVTITSPNHNLFANDANGASSFIQLSNLQGTNVEQFNGNNYKVQSTTVNTFTINQIPAPGSFTYLANSGYITPLVNFSIKTKQFNLSLEEGLQTRLGYTDLYINNSPGNSFTIDMYMNGGDSLPVTSNAVASHPETSNAIALTQNLLWKRDYEDVIGQFFQYNIYQNDAQMLDPSNNLQFELHAMILNVDRAGRLTY